MWLPELLSLFRSTASVFSISFVPESTKLISGAIAVIPPAAASFVAPKAGDGCPPAGGRAPRYPALEEPKQVLRAETAREMRSYMQAVTSSIGTGWRANVADLKLAVKTGTAQMIDQTTRRFSDTDFIASCMALLPAEEPAIVLYLAIIKPRGVEYLGGRIAAPPIREAAEALVNYLGIPRGKNPYPRPPDSYRR